MEKIMLLLLLSCSSLTTFAEVRLPAVFSDHMVIQRNKPIVVWGWATVAEKIEVSFKGQIKKTVANKEGDWRVVFPASGSGGPYQLRIKGKNEVLLNDVLVGDVWFCSGQSNMEMSVISSKNGLEELKDANYHTIRLFTVPNALSEKPQLNVKNAKWLECNAESARDFSAVAFYFARHLVKDIDVPIGLINSSWGGSDIETWISADAMSNFKSYAAALRELKNINYEELSLKRDRWLKAWKDTLERLEPGTVNKWYSGQLNDSDWTEVTLPAKWKSAGVEGNGVGWYRKEFTIQEGEAPDGAILNFGTIQDRDETFLNGVRIGETVAYNKKRVYVLPPALLHSGSNVLAVKIYNSWGEGGFTGKQEDLFLQLKTGRRSLAGQWKFKKGYISPNPGLIINQNNFPSLLYNTKVNPFVCYPIKGVLWYQGENNTGRPQGYDRLLAALINDWRSHWKIGDFPFLVVQLPNYMKETESPSNSNWAQLREAQSAALSLPNTGLAVTIDLGDADDIHPQNKQDVAYRLALLAKNIAYGQHIISSGPRFTRMTISGAKAVIDFTDIGSGLLTKDKYGYVKGFTIAGADRTFYWAKAFINNNRVEVYADQVSNPVAVRYAWADNPDGTLYNAEKLPAAPFRTDNW